MVYSLLKIVHIAIGIYRKQILDMPVGTPVRKGAEIKVIVRSAAPDTIPRKGGHYV